MDDDDVRCCCTERRHAEYPDKFVDYEPPGPRTPWALDVVLWFAICLGLPVAAAVIGWMR